MCNNMTEGIVRRCLMINLNLLIENPRKLYQTMIKEDLDFKKFVEENKNKSTDDIINEFGLDLFKVGNV